jgi:hypothetical protein
MKNLKINVFVKKHLGSISYQVLLSKKWHFWQFLSQSVRKTARFYAVFVYFGRHGGLFASFNSLYHHPLPGHYPHQ